MTWLSTEATPATESTATFDQISGHPQTAAAYSEISRQLLKQSDPSAEAVVMLGLAADVSVAADQAVFQGTGTEQPQGIIGTAGVGAISGTTLAYAGLVQAQTDIANGNAVLDPLSLGYVTTPTVAQTLKARQQFANTDSPLWLAAVHEGLISGVKAISTKQIPAAKMIYGDWSQAAVAEWGGAAGGSESLCRFQGRHCGSQMHVCPRCPGAASSKFHSGVLNHVGRENMLSTSFGFRHQKQAAEIIPDPEPDPRAQAPTQVKVLKPFWLNRQTIAQPEQTVTVPAWLAADLVARKRAESVEG